MSFLNLKCRIVVNWSFFSTKQESSILKNVLESISREMKEINSIPADGTQNPSSDADFEKEFRRIIKCGTKIQVNKIT